MGVNLLREGQEGNILQESFDDFFLFSYQKQEEGIFF